MKNALIDLIVDRKELYILRDGKLDYILVRVEKWTSMDVLNLQLGVMSIQEVGREFGVKVCFHGASTDKGFSREEASKTLRVMLER